MPARDELTPSLPGLSPVAGKPVVACFDGGRLSSNAGVLGLREIEKQLGIADRLATCLGDPRTPGRVVHRLAEIIRFRPLMIAAGYEDGTDVDSLRRDPAFKLALSAGRCRPALAVHHFAPGEPARFPYPAAHGLLFGRFLLRRDPAGAETDRAGYS